MFERCLSKRRNESRFGFLIHTGVMFECLFDCSILSCNIFGHGVAGKDVLILDSKFPALAEL